MELAFISDLLAMKVVEKDVSVCDITPEKRK